LVRNAPLNQWRKKIVRPCSEKGGLKNVVIWFEKLSRHDVPRVGGKFITAVCFQASTCSVNAHGAPTAFGL